MAEHQDPLVALLVPERLTAVVDVGANPIDGDPPYKGMLQKRLCRVVGFEPQPTAIASLNASKSDLETYLPYAVGDGTRGVLKVCESSGMTSMFTPDPRVLNLFRGFPQWGRVTGELNVETRTLDSIAEIDQLDMLKIDVQGSELAVFTHGALRLGQAVVVHTEVSFLALYEGQPVFGQVDLALRGLGFVPHAFAKIRRRMLLPLETPGNPYGSLNQLLEADIVYVRDFTRPEAMSAEQLKHLAIIAHHCYRSYDLAANCMMHLMQRKALDADTLERYRKFFVAAS